MNWYLTTLTRGGKIIERGWMLADNDNELVRYARTLGYGIDLKFLGEADLTSTFPTIVVGTEPKEPTNESA